MKRKVDVSLRDPAARARDVKLGRGGIREVEFFVQAHQLVHAGKDARLRVRGTLAALERLAACGYVPAAQAAELAQAYRFLRDVEHKLQVVHQRQTHRLPDDPTEATHLARRLGFCGPDARTAFAAAHARATDVVHAAFDGLFHGAEAERRRAEEPALTALVEELEQADAARARLATLGFADVEAAYRNLRLLRDGPPHAPASPRRRQALAALAPSLLREIARSATPDRALHHTATFLSTIGARTSYLHLLLENPGVMRLLIRLFASSEYLSQFFLRHPELLDSLVRADLVRVRRAREDLTAELDARLAAAPDLEAELDELRRFRHEEFLRIGIHDIEGELAPEEVSAQLSTLAEVCLAAACALARREVLRRTGLPAELPTEGLAILGLGKLGGAELDYNSDLDLVFVYDPGPEAWWTARLPAHDFFTRVAQRTISVLQTTTREGIAYRIDTRLRPSGNQGPLVCSLEAFARYHRTAAAVWERQALVKARVLAGPAALRAQLEAIVAACVYGRGLDAAEAAEIARLRERMAHERGAGDARQVNIKTGRGGLVDVEFLVQVLQLRHGHAHPALRVPGTRAALAALAAEGLLSADDARVLGGGYDFLRALENRLRLERDQPVEALDTDPAALLPLARRLGYGGTDAEAVARLRAEHARTRAAIRAVYERHLGGG
jgi:glutamate-ammonia-ligase adenylyltransferase